MTLFLNTLFIVVSVLFFVGRMYEIVMITDTATGLLTSGGIVSTAFMMVLICVIAACCGVIIFAAEKTESKPGKFPVGIWGYAAGAFFVAGGIISSLDCFRYGGFIGYHLMEVIGGTGLIVLGNKNIKGKKIERLPALAVILLASGVCINSVIYEIKTIYNTDYLYRSLAGLCTLVFFLVLFQNAYSPKRYSRMMLYIAAFVNYTFTGTGSLAAVLGAVAGGTVSLGQLFYNIGFTLIGIYSLFVAFYITPEEISLDSEEWEEEEDIVEYRPVKAAVQPVYSKPREVVPSDDVYRTDNINHKAIEELFAIKAAKEEGHTAAKAADSEAEISMEKTVMRPVVKTQKTAEENSETVIIPKTKSTFKADGKKTSAPAKKIVYKAPK